MTLQDLAQAMIHQRASDLFISSGNSVFIRVDGQLQRLHTEPLNDEVVREMAHSVLLEDEKHTLASRLAVDTSVGLEGLGRFRMNIFHQNGQVSMALRRVASGDLSFEDLNLPVDVLTKLSSERRGLVLVTGTAGSGKSTTLAAMVSYMNRRLSRHIITIEDPVEYSFESDKSLIEQREVGLDTPDFPQALRDVVRQSPDVIMIGEMRDKETVDAAISACETGHLVLSTLHTTNASQTVERIVNFFPPHLQKQTRAQLAAVTRGILSLRLLKRRTGAGLIPAVEIMLGSPLIRKKIADGAIEEMAEVTAKSGAMGMQTFNQALIDLYKRGLIASEEGARTSDSMHEFNMLAVGVFATEASEIDKHGDTVAAAAKDKEDQGTIPFLE